MANSILDSHMPTSSNAILTSHGWPNNTSGNALLVSHGDPYVEGGGGGFTAVLNAGTGELVISGTGFGTKSPAAPLYFSDFSGATVDDPAALLSGGGFDNEDHTANATFPAPVYKTGEGIGGSKSLRITRTSGANNFHHVEKWITASQELFVSSWQRFTSPSGSGTLQVKGHRVGPLISTTDVHENYNLSNVNRFSTSWYVDSTGNLSSVYTDAMVQNGCPAVESWYEPFADCTAVTNTTVGNHINIENYFRYNTVTPAYVADGVTTQCVNGTTVFTKTDRACRPDASTQPLNMAFCQFTPGMDETGPVVIQDFSRPYIDNTRKRVFLGNASTLAACTGGRFLLPPTEWEDTLIKCSNCTNIPAGYDWVYVMDENDTEIASGPRT
jgi:hypothetical protein